MFLTIIAFILIVGFLVLVHEFGHFIVAKKSKMEVTEFGLGFPPTIFKKKVNGTEYCLNLIPLGGYVKIKGEDGAHADEPNSFSAKPVYIRALALVAGVTMNIIAGWLIFVVLFAISAPVELDSSVPQKYILSEHIAISEIIIDSPADKAGLLAGDEIKSANQENIQTIEQFQDIISRAQGAVLVTYIRDKQESEVDVAPEIIENISPDNKIIGVALARVGNVRYPIHKAVIQGSKSAYGYMERITVAVAKIIKGAFIGQGLGGVGGPVAIAVATNDMVDLGFDRVLIFTALLSFNLAIFNILPFPALDGGRLIFLAVEAVRRKPSKKEVEEWFHRVGFILFMLFAIFITYRDIMRFGGRIWQSVVG